MKWILIAGSAYLGLAGAAQLLMWLGRNARDEYNAKHPDFLADLERYYAEHPSFARPR